MPVYKVKGKRKYYFMCRYSTATGERKQYHSKQYDTRKEAEMAESAFKVSDKPASSVLFLDVALEWINSSAPNNSYGTLESKKYYVDGYFEPFHKMRIADITTMDIKRKLINSDRLIYTKSFSEMSTITKNKALSYLCSIFSYAQIYYGLQNNPANHIERFKATTKERLNEMRFLDVNEFNEVYSCAKNVNDDFADILYMLFWTGLRLNECLSLTFEDFNGTSVHVSKQYIARNGGYWDALKTKNSVRDVELNYKCIETVEKRYKMYSNKPKFNESWFIFGGYKHICPASVRQWKNKTIEKYGFEFFRLHDLRHSHVAYLISKNIPMYNISRRLGHSGIDITMNRYGHLTKDANMMLINAINKE